eukprot:TRINITY_DN23156_c0_g1_i1.p1 TRINITY_DN23156_c0_g1~~TRINITY_DN23156_c0_g1_i1.p1  ORF type:complete len:111 (+),score=34.24 TRINITY_DN23156_c0_g1_i1:30-335(+)
MSRSVRCLDCNTVFHNVSDPPSGMCTCPPPAGYKGPILPGGYRMAPWEWADEEEQERVDPKVLEVESISNSSSGTKIEAMRDGGYITGSLFFDTMLKSISA